MATTLVTLTGDVSDAIGSDFDPRRTKAYVRHNTSKIVTDSGHPMHLGGGSVNVGSDGTFTLPNVVASTSLVSNLQATVYVDYADPATRQRATATFGPYDLSAETGTVDIRTLETVQALDPSFASTTMAAMAQLLADMQEISGLTGEDAAVAALVAGTAGAGPLTRGALSATFASLINVAGRGVVGGTNGDAALDVILAAAGPGDTIYFPRAATAYQFATRHDVPDAVTLKFAAGQPVTVTGNTGWLRLGNQSRVEGHPVVTGASQTVDAKCIDLQTSKTDQYVEAVCTTWRGFFVHGVASIRPHLRGVRGTTTGASNFIRLTTGNTNGWSAGTVGDVIEPRLEDCHSLNSWAGIQLDGDWNHITWRTAGHKVRNPQLIGCSGSGSTGYAGIFVNSAVGGSAIGCWGDDNADYGVGSEYCQDFHFISCQGRGNLQHGVSIQSNAERCAMIACTGVENGGVGVNLAYSMLITTGGSDTPGSGNKIIGCAGQSNTSYDIAIAGAMADTTLTGNTAAKLLDGGAGTITEATGVPYAAKLAGSAGTWFGPPAGRTTAAPANGTSTAIPVFLPAITKVSYLAARVTVAGGTGSVLRMGIYRDNNGIPGALLHDASTVASATTGNKQINLPTSLILSPGTYWLVCVPQGAPTPNPTLTIATAGSGLVNYSSAVAALDGAIAYFATGVTGALPASFMTGFGGATANPVAVVMASA